MLALAFMELAASDATALGLDPAAFGAFYDEALPRVYGYHLHRVGGTVAVAEDLTQETFLAAVGELRKGRLPDEPIPWIYGIARHKLLDHYRRQQRLEQTLAVAGPAALEDIPLDPSGSEARERAVSALAEVPASQRGALVLVYVDGFSIAEAADLLERTEKATESLLARGRESFKRAYREMVG